MICFSTDVFDGFWQNNIVQSIEAAAIFSALLWVIQQLRYYFKLYRHYNKRSFNIYYKGRYHNGNDKPIGTVSCKVPIASNKIKYHGTITATPEGRFKGEFLMNPFRLSLGDGYHYHLGYDGFNFPKIVIKESEIFLIETSFVSLIEKSTDEDNFGIHYKGYIWERIN